MKRFRPVLVPLTLVLTTILLLAACSTGEPQEQTFEVKVEKGTMVKPDTIKVKQEDTVTLNITTDEPWFFHIHGYELMKRVNPGAVALFTFEADATGSFAIGLHKTMPAMPGVDLGPPQFAEFTDYEMEGRLEVRPR